MALTHTSEGHPSNVTGTTTSGGPITLRETGPSRSGRGALLAGKYRLEMLLGEGGMGSVWSAYNRELELPVAIKLLRAGRNGHRFAERLRREARAGARLAHPSIVRVFDVASTDAGEPFLVMELLTGETLATALARGPLDGARAVQLLLPLADALSVAHAKGVIHRDLKPENVFLCAEGERCQPKLLDFGIAKLGDGTEAKLTEDGTVLGSPHYMSPEQIAGEEVDAATDVWSLCVVLYRAVAGNTPFTGADKRAVMDSILTDAPAALPESVDAGLRDILRWGLGKDPLDRPRTMRELGEALARWLTLHGVQEDACGAPVQQTWLLPGTRPTVPCAPPPPGRRRRELVAAVGLLVLGGSLAWTGSAQTSVTAPPAVVAAPRPAQAVAALAEAPAQAPPAPTAVLDAPAAALPAPSSAPVPSAAAPRRARPARRAPQLPF